MAGRRINGGIIGVVNSTSDTSAKGVWSFTEQVLSRKGGNWPKPVLLIDFLVIAGGGGGGAGNGGGGGAGGYQELTSQTLNLGSPYTVTVGGGGNGGAEYSGTGTNGENSVFGATTSIGGGFGGTYNGSAWVAISADTDSLAKVSSNDTTAGYLNGKLVAGTAITFLENNDGGNETLTINATDPTALAIALG